MAKSADDPIEKIGVVGAGAMGHGIAQVAAMAGYQVELFDIDAAALKRALAAVRSNLDAGVERGVVDPSTREAALAALSTTTVLESAASGADLVIEAAPEQLELKRELFAQLDALSPPHAILATNTSSLSVTKIAAATERPGRVVGMHFFNPVHIMKLLEIVQGEETEERAVEIARAIGVAMGKTPIVVKDSPGFASSRLGVILGLEAMRMVEDGVASAQDIDTAMELGYRHPMGPLRLTDLVGLDVRLAIAQYLYRETGSDRFKPPEILERMVAEGKLGKKAGEGFYVWT
ncbi:MAG: 3-hydroxyacyl-CoA dehydrogenase family protein [Candidatus Palauibacterales bacterium]|nr:3-hydroxyacyl-CoA dehydrogenase family protein [Candidatus Palauibacterales bacterium]